MSLHLPMRALVRVLAAGVLLLAAAGLVAGWSMFLAPHPFLHGWEGLFDLAAENNLPTWYSTVLLGTLALLFAVHAARSSRLRDGHAWRWGAFAAATLGVSVLEDASLFERTLEFTARSTHFHVSRGAWVATAIAVVVAGAMTAWPLLRTLPRRRALLVVAAALMAGAGHSAFGRLGGWLAWHGGPHQISFVLARVSEETCKMLGSTGLIAAAVSTLRDGGDLRVVMD